LTNEILRSGSVGDYVEPVIQSEARDQLPFCSSLRQRGVTGEILRFALDDRPTVVDKLG
jgi:hypothetical protein